MNYITYLAHGDTGYINECQFSLLKFLQVYNLRPPASTAILIYTDKPQVFESFIPFFQKFIIEQVDEEKIKSWMQGTGYVHRAKSKMIEEALQKYSSNLLFFDTDTYITAPIDAIWKNISNGVIYLHESEGTISRKASLQFRKWDRFLESAAINYGTQRYVYSKQLQIWNSGVLGISPRYAPVMNEVLLLIDALYKQFPKHIAEQVACSYCFEKAAEIRPAKDTVFHYWNLKEFRQLLTLFFERNAEESIPNLVKKAHHIDAAAILRHKTAYRQLSWIQRSIKALTGSGWNIRQYRKKL